MASAARIEDAASPQLTIAVPSHIDQSAKMHVRRDAEALNALLSRKLYAKPGDFVSLVDSGGYGKTTLLKPLAGLNNQAGVRIKVGDRKVKRLDPSVSVVFQHPSLLRRCTVEEVRPCRIMRWTSTPKPFWRKRRADPQPRSGSRYTRTHLVPDERYPRCRTFGGSYVPWGL